MFKDEFLQIWIGGLVHEAFFVKEEVVADSAADVGMPDSLDLGNAWY